MGNIILIGLLVFGVTFGVAKIEHNNVASQCNTLLQQKEEKNIQIKKQEKKAQYKIGYGKKEKQTNGYVIHQEGFEWVFVLEK